MNHPDHATRPPGLGSRPPAGLGGWAVSFRPGHLVGKSGQISCASVQPGERAFGHQTVRICGAARVWLWGAPCARLAICDRGETDRPSTSSCTHMWDEVLPQLVAGFDSTAVGDVRPPTRRQWVTWAARGQGYSLPMPRRSAGDHRDTPEATSQSRGDDRRTWSAPNLWDREGRPRDRVSFADSSAW
jgi:hypothetical protein